MEDFRRVRAEKMEKCKKYGSTIVVSGNFGKQEIFGERHKEAADWLTEKISGATKAEEIRKTMECENIFDVVTDNVYD